MLTVPFMTVSASAQFDKTLRGQPVLMDQSGMLLERMPEYRECANGNITGCYLIQFGDCVDDNPRVAIPACTRQLNQQDNRRRLTNVRFERAVLYALRGYARTTQGEHDLAVRDYDRAIKAKRDVFWIHSERGDAQFNVGDYAGALDSYRAALELEPEIAVALSNRALIYAAAPDDALHDVMQALEDAQRAVDLAPEQAPFADSLAIAHAANGDFARATATERRQ